MSIKKLLLLFFLSIFAFLGGRYVTSVLAQEQDNKIKICHATDANSNPYVVNNPNKNGDVSGHDGHNGPVWFNGIEGKWGDIIPPFDYGDGHHYGGKNWTDQGQAIWNNSCKVPTSSSPACENPKNLENYLDKIDLGDSTSETAHNAEGWGADPGGGNYGNRDGGQNFSLVVGKNECNKGGKSAYFNLNAGTNFANKIVIRHLDGLSNRDSFDVFANGNLVGHYSDVHDSEEVWVSTEFLLPNLTGSINIEIKLTDKIWSECETWGQLAINWVEITGYECAGEQSPSPIASPTPAPQVLSDNTSVSNGPPGPPQCAAQKPPTPQLLSVVRTSPTTVKLTWSSVTPASYYSIFYGTTPGNYQFGVANTGNTTNFVVGALNPNLNYYFAVRAVNDCMPSDPSNELSTGGVLGASTEKVLGASTEQLAGTHSDLSELRLVFASVIFVGSLASGVQFLHAKKKS